MRTSARPAHGLALGFAVVLPLACSSFGADGGGGPASGADAGPKDAASSEGSTPIGADAGDARAEAGADAVTCDEFERSSVLGDQTFWDLVDGASPTAPSVSNGMLHLSAESSGSKSLRSKSRARQDIVKFKASFTIAPPSSEWGGHTGSTRIFDLDASVDTTDPAEFSALEIDGSGWHLLYRDFDAEDPTASTHVDTGPTVKYGVVTTLAFEERFHETEGYIHVLVDGVPAFTVDRKNTKGQPRDRWLLKVGLIAKDGSTPALAIDFDQVCVAP
ncbi:MAG: hypothetical protein U0270_45370 [Labilithrix sp.]